jgi:hypothetical protein
MTCAKNPGNMNYSSVWPKSELNAPFPFNKSVHCMVGVFMPKRVAPSQQENLRHTKFPYHKCGK